MYVGLTNDKPTNVMEVLVRTHAAEITEAVTTGGDVTKVLLAAATNTIVELQGALARLLEMIPPDVRNGLDLDALIPDDDPDDDPGEAPTDVQKAALALLAAMAEGDTDDDKAINLLCDIIDAQRRENEDLRAQLAERDDGGQQ